MCVLQDFAKAGAGGAGMMFTFHLEACADPATLTQDTPHPVVVDMANKVKQAGMKVNMTAGNHRHVLLEQPVLLPSVPCPPRRE